VYDVSANTGWVSVGTDQDTSGFAVQTLRRWWDTIGRHRYPAADRLLICADGGGSHGSRIRAWKIELAKFSADTGLRVTACHLPPGTSKWNKIEHRLFSQITMNWRGRPLKTHQIIVDLINATTTTTGLTVHCVLDTGQYPTGIKYTKKDVEALPITRHDFHGGLSSERCNWILLFYLRPADSRPSKVISKAFRAAFQRLDQRCCPLPVGSRLMIAR
jgi:Rhodopirellula transposase DDE domain